MCQCLKGLKIFKKPMSFLPLEEQFRSSTQAMAPILHVLKTKYKTKRIDGNRKNTFM